MSIELTEGQIIAKTLQEIKDTLNGGITHRNMKSIRTFFVVSGQDSLDSDYPMYLPFNIPLSTQTIVSVNVSFWLLPFRAYSKAASSGGGSTSGSSSVTTTPSGGGSTSGSGGSSTPTSSSGGSHSHTITLSNHAHSLTLGWLNTQVTDGHYHAYLAARVSTQSGGGTVATSSVYSAHSHSVTIAAHTHTTPNHSHNIEHTHTTPNHTHTIDFGIYEENNSPSVTLFVSRDAGYTYPYEIGTYSANQVSLDITSFVDSPGSKMLKFESTTLGRLSVQIEITLDVSR